MIARSVNAAAGVVQAAMEQGRQTAAGIALALDSAGLLMSPEMAAEVERLRLQVVELRETTGEAGRDAARARRERDLMRERVSEPNGCTYCGLAKRWHGRQWIASAGVHAWERPSDEQVKARMLARRVARSPLPATPELDQVLEDLTGANLARWEEEQDNARLRLALKSAQRGRREARGLYEITEASRKRWRDALIQDRGELETLRARVSELEEQRKADHETWQHDLRTARGEREAAAARIAELEAERHTTNEALDDAVQALRVDRIAELEAGITWRDAERDRWADVRSLVERAIDKGWSSVDTIDLEDALGPEPAVQPVEDPCHPCGCPKRFNRHADGCPTLASESADKLTAPLAPSDEREAARRSVDRAFPAVAEFLADGVTRLNVPLQVLREDSHDGPLHHSYRVPRDLPESDGAK